VLKVCFAAWFQSFKLQHYWELSCNCLLCIWRLWCSLRCCDQWCQEWKISLHL